MADVYTVLFVLIGMLLSLPALLIGINLLFPNVTKRVHTRLKETPRKSFGLGLPITAVILLWVLTTVEANAGLIRASGFIMAGFGMTLGTIGAAGMARLLGERITPIAKETSTLTNLLRGAVVFELSCLFPLVGWLVFAPFAGITVLGAAVFGILKWQPKRAVSDQISLISHHSPAPNP